MCNVNCRQHTAGSKLGAICQVQPCWRASRWASYADTTATNEQVCFPQPTQASRLKPQLSCLVRAHDRDSASSLARAPVTRSCARERREAPAGMGFACMQPESPHANRHGSENTSAVTAFMPIILSPDP